MRILIAECKQEISSFNPKLSTYEDFSVSFGHDLIDYHRGVRNEVGGALRVLEQQAEIEIVPAYSARMNTSGGTLGNADFARITREFLAPIRSATGIDALFLSMHGSMAAETEHDTEGFLLEETRKIVGEKIPIVVSLDLHGVLTDRMLRHSDALVPFHTYPHVDFFETGERAAHLLLRILAGEARPVSARVPIPALVRGDELITDTGLFGVFEGRAAQLETSGVALSAGMFIGNPFTDVPDLLSNALVVTNGDSERAGREATELAQDFWSVRERLQAQLTSLEESVRIAIESNGHIVLVDAADAPSSGASGDSNAILTALLAAGCSRTVLLPIVDAPAVDAAIAAGVGASIRPKLGGTVDSARFKPIAVDAVVRSLSDGWFRSESHGQTWFAGPTAVLQVGSMTVVVTSRPCNLWDRSLFFANGHDPAKFDIVIVKCPHCQPRFFAAKAERLINVDAPGSSSANLRSLGHTRCVRPIYPLDPDVEFVPEVKIFQRDTK
ncbi:MAG TPA: M81 family metallopeptidase [Bryobacteraceae bacterium]|nr:M81 family metallopeptidase [Bryobacteraceae bacterium]